MATITTIDGKAHITTPRLLLREYRLSDAPSLHKAYGDPEVMKYWSSLPHANVQVTEESLAKVVVGPSNGTTDFALCLRNSHTPDDELVAVGKAGVWQGSEVGFLLPRELWGKGYGKEAVEAVLGYLFSLEEEKDGKELPRFERIVADVDPNNEGSIALLTKVGFKKVGYRERTLNIGDKWFDSVDLAVEREEWLTLRKM